MADNNKIQLRAICSWLLVLDLIGTVICIIWCVVIANRDEMRYFDFLFYFLALVSFIHAIFISVVLRMISITNNNFSIVENVLNNSLFKSSPHTLDKIAYNHSVGESFENQQTNFKFSENQLVIDINSNDYFRITSMKSREGVNYYYSNEFHKEYPENQLLDYNDYCWGRCGGKTADGPKCSADSDALSSQLREGVLQITNEKMRRCPNCGAEIEEEHIICPHCDYVFVGGFASHNSEICNSRKSEQNDDLHPGEK